MDKSLNGYIEEQANRILEWVWYNGNDALREGEGVCYEVGHGTATDSEGRRHNAVERPSATNNRAFAGVAARDYSATTGGQFIEINCPGSRGVNVAIGQDVVTNTNVLGFTAGGGTGAGRFVLAGFEGRGTMIPRQTVTAVRSSSLTGGWSLATDGKTLTASTHGASVGDTLLILGSETNTVAASAGKHRIASITDANTVVLAFAATASTPGGALSITGAILVGSNPKCQADLVDGPESGGVEFVAPPAAGAAGNNGTEMSYMVGGMTYICGGMTLATGDPNGALATPANYGLWKGFRGLGTITTELVRITLATAGQQGMAHATPSTALASIQINAANEFAVLLWQGIWILVGHSGATLA